MVVFAIGILKMQLDPSMKPNVLKHPQRLIQIFHLLPFKIDKVNYLRRKWLNMCFQNLVKFRISLFSKFLSI